MNKRVALAMVWAGVLLGFIGLYMGMTSRKGELSGTGATITCGSPWSPNTYARFYRGVDQACTEALGNLGTVAVIVTLVGVLMVVAVLAIAVATPVSRAGTPDHP